MWNKELKAAKQCAAAAGKKILEIYYGAEKLEVEYKEDHSPLTRADKASNQIIVERLKKQFPGYAVLSEEEKEKEEDQQKRLGNDYCFIVDPLDGTKEFIKRNGQFTVNIALSCRNRVVMGAIYVPVTGELYYASEGDGSFLETPDGNISRLSVSDNKELSSLRFVISNSHGCREMEELIEKYNINNFVKVGSSLKGCMVAAGRADVYYRFNPTMEWDTAAMQCIAEEAGAVFRQMDGTPMTYNRENSRNEKGFYILNCSENLLVRT